MKKRIADGLIESLKEVVETEIKRRSREIVRDGQAVLAPVMDDFRERHGLIATGLMCTVLKDGTIQIAFNIYDFSK